MTREQRAAYWRGIVEKQAESGLSAAAFCREHNTNPQRFYYWRRRFQEEQRSPESSAFLELVPCSAIPGQSSGIRIHLPNELSIEVSRGFDPFTLRSVVEAVGGVKGCSR